MNSSEKASSSSHHADGEPAESSNTTATGSEAVVRRVNNHNEMQDGSRSRPASIVAPPSVQFDEQNLLASPTAQREARLGKDTSKLASSPPPASNASLGSPVGTNKSLHAYRRDPSGSHLKGASSSSLRLSQNHLRRSSRASAGGSSINLASTPGRGSTSGSKRSRANPTIITVPVWARDESPSPPHSPYASPQAHSVPRSLHDVESIHLPPASSEIDTSARPSTGHSAQNGPANQAGDQHNAISVVAATPEAVEEAEAQEAQSTTPDRWWTFTLPHKYRSRLHEHHLRMAFHNERMRSSSGEGNKSAKRNSKKRSSSDSSRFDSNSDMGSDTEMREIGRGRDRDERRHDHGLGAENWHGVAAGLGASGLLNWKHAGRQQKDSLSPFSNMSEKTVHGTGNGHAARQESPSPDGTSTTKADDQDLEKQHPSDRGMNEKERYPTMSFKARMENPDVYTVRQPATPGWASPWKPEERGNGRGFDNGYRFGTDGYFPRSETGRSYGSKGANGKNSWFEAWKNFLVHNPFVPLLFRLINLAFTSATLAVAIRLMIVLGQEEARDAVGSSPLVAIIFAPLSIIHVCFQIWLEYFGRPIGLWTVQSKLSYTVVELVFICLWSAELSLTFDNYFTSTLVCVTFGSPYVGPRQPPANRVSPLDDPSRKPYLCRLQGSLIGLVFVSLLAYVIVLAVSLFRIFVRVTGSRR